MLLLLRNDDQKVVDKKVGLVPRSKDPLVDEKVVDEKVVLVPR